jgi:3-mercaptopyruvate sulfurtransferase SseA
MRKTAALSVPWFLTFLFSIFLNDTLASEKRPVWWERAQAQASRDGYQLVTIPELSRLYGSKSEFVIVDVRPRYEFRAGHLPEALQIEFHLGERSRLGPDKRQEFERLLGPDKGREVIIYCRNYQ